MIPSTKERKKNAGFFRLCYDGLCRRQNLMPLSGVKAHLTKNTLDFNGDRVKLEEWGPILLALGLDRSLHFIAIRSRHPARKALEDIDTEIKARSVTKRPVLLTRYILYMLVDSLSQCLSNSLVLTCLELEGLPLGIDYLSILCQGITACKSLQNISFYRSNIGDEGCGKLCMIIRNLPNIISLDFSGCELTEKGALSIAEMLKFQSLQRYNETWKQTLRYRSPNIEAMPGLRRVTLNHNMHLGNQGVLHLVDAIKEDLWLRAIDLQNCGVGESGATCVLEMLDVNNSLYIADLRGNRGVRENLIQQIMRKLANNNNNVTHEYQWISLDPQLMKKPSSCSLASKPSFYSCRSIRSSIRPPVFRPPVSNVSKSTLNRCPSVSVVSNQNSPKKKTGIPWRIDVRMKQVKNTTNATPGTPQMVHNCETVCPTVSVTPPPTPCPSGLNGISKVKPDALMERLAKEISLRKEAEQQKEELQQEVQRLAKELEREQAEKEGFCLLKVEAFEAIQQTLDRFVDFMRNVKKAQAADLLELEESQEIQHQSQDEPQTQHSVIKKSHSAHVNSSSSHHRPCRISKSASVFSPEEAAPVQSIEKEMGDYLKSSRLPSNKSSKPVKIKPVSPNPRKSRVKLTQKVDGVTRKPKARRSVPLISSGSLSGDHTDRGYSSELENRMLLKQSDSLSSPKSVQVTKVQELFEDLIQEYDNNNGTLMVKKRNGLIDRKLQSLENEMLKDVVKTRTRLLNGMKPKPLNAHPFAVRRKVNHKLGEAASKEGKSQPEYDTDSSGRSKSWSVFSKSSSVHSPYSTEDDVY